MSFKDKNILVVGGSSGIGLSLINKLLAEGAHVYNVSRHASDQWAGDVSHLEYDIMGDISSLSAALPEVLHGVVYSVGSINLRPFNRLTEADFINDYRINVVGAALVVQQGLKALKTAQGASVVLMSSVAAKAGMSFHASIAAAKGGVEGLALSLAAELASQYIRVNVVAPSLTETPLAQNLLSTPEKKEAAAKRHPLGKFGQSSDIAAAVAFLLSDESSWVTGQVIGIDGGLGNLKG
jgi:NAD(P)-dependent dehydrogenase (short-subunit alcohol dehydrogenase family)